MELRQWPPRRNGRSRAAAVLLAAGLALVSARAALGGAWNLKAGDGLAIIDVTLDQGDRFFDDHGRLGPAARYRSTETGVYVEYGITDWLMAVARPSLDVTQVGAPDPGRYVGPGATEAGVQLHLATFGTAVLAAQGTFRLPGTATRSNPAELGNTDKAGDFRLLAGAGFSIGPLPAFVDLEGAYRLRSDGAAAEWHGDATVGLTLTPKFQLLIKSFNQLPTGRGTAWLPSSAYSKLEVSGVRHLSPTWDLELGGFLTVAGRDALMERGVVVAVWHRF